MPPINYCKIALISNVLIDRGGKNHPGVGGALEQARRLVVKEIQIKGKDKNVLKGKGKEMWRRGERRDRVRIYFRNLGEKQSQNGSV